MGRYDRHLSLTGFTQEHQTRLQEAKVLVVGCGGLGSGAIPALAAAGVGHLVLVDPDEVSESNLQRQTLFGEKDTGSSKAELAASRVVEINSRIEVEWHAERCDASNVESFIHDVDAVLDCSDNFATRFLLNDACFFSSTPLFFASVLRFQGQFCLFNADEERTNYRDLFPEEPAPDETPNCSEAGVLGPLALMMGNLQALRAIQYLSGAWEVECGRMENVNGLNGETQVVQVMVNEHNPLRTGELSRIEERCDACEMDREELSWAEVQGLDGAVLVDVREDFELQARPFDSNLHIPMGQMVQRQTELPSDRPVVFVCAHGIRSLNVCHWARQNGIQAYSLTGGVEDGIQE